MAKYVVAALTILGLAALAVIYLWPDPLPEAAPIPSSNSTSSPDTSLPSRELETPDLPDNAPTAPVPPEPIIDANAIQGRVVDADGNPVGGAEVRAYEASRGAVRTTSDADGRFVITGLLPDSYRVSAHAEGFNDAVLEPIKTPASDLVLELLPCSIARGTVVDASTNIPLTRFEVAYLETPPVNEKYWAIMTQSGHVPWIPQSDVNGKFEIPNIKSGEVFAVAARAEGYEPAYAVMGALEPGASSESRRIELVGAGRISGRITDASGNPLASAAIHIGERWNRPPVVFAGDDGHYELTGLVRGPITLWATHGHYVPASQSLILNPGEQHRIDFVLDSGVAIVGYATIGNEPMEGLEIIVSGDSDFPSKRAVTDRDGSYRVEGMTGEEYRVLARAREWAQARGFGMLPDAQQTLASAGLTEVVADFHFPAATSSLFGMVTVDGAAPVSGELLGDFYSDGTVTHVSTALDDSGAYRIDGIVPGDAHLTVHVTDSDGITRTKIVDVSIPEATELRFDVEFGGAATILGRFDGVPTGNFAQVNLLKGAWELDFPDLQSIIDLESLQVAESQVAPDGTFAFERIEYGEYTVVGFSIEFSPNNEDRIESIRYVSEVVDVQDDTPIEIHLAISRTPAP